jgi:hypothetical protein
MNQKYEDLLYQAGLTASGCWDELGIYEQEAIKRFAELIIDEMYSFLLNTFKDDEPWHSRAEVKKHFGVES